MGYLDRKYPPLTQDELQLLQESAERLEEEYAKADAEDAEAMAEAWGILSAHEEDGPWPAPRKLIPMQHYWSGSMQIHQALGSGHGGGPEPALGRSAIPKDAPREAEETAARWPRVLKGEVQGQKLTFLLRPFLQKMQATLKIDTPLEYKVTLFYSAEATGPLHELGTWSGEGTLGVGDKSLFLSDPQDEKSFRGDFFVKEEDDG